MKKENIVCGRGVIREIFKSNINIDTLYIDKNINKDSLYDILSSAKKRNVDTRFVCRNDIYNICKNDVNQGVAARISGYKYLKFNELIDRLRGEAYPFVLILDSIQDPRNLGAILRSAECIGVKNIIVPQKRSVGITDVVWKSSMGALAHLNICRVNNLLNVVQKFKEHSFKIVATDMKCSKYVYDESYNFPLVLIVGSEHLGVSNNLLRECDIRVKIPMFGNIESFNVSVASSIIMYEVRKKQREKIEN